MKNNSKLIKPIVIIIVVVLIAIGGYFVWNSIYRNDNSEDTSVEAKDNIRFEYEDLIENRKFDEAERLVRNSVLDESEKESMIEGIEYFRSGREDDLKHLLSTEGTDDFNFGSAKIIGDIYEYRGDKENAKKYYELSIELLKKSNNSVKEDEIALLELKLESLNE